MRHVAPLLCVALLTACSAVAPSRQSDSQLVARMTLEEKVGQMTQLALGALSKTVGNATTPHVLDGAKLGHAIVDRHVGSILNVADIAFDVEHWDSIHAAIRQATESSRLKVPVVYAIDAVHGANYTRGATLFPHSLGMAAAWSEELIEQAAAFTARDVKRSGITWNFAPVVDVARTPLWSRFFETYGEDTFAAARFGVAAVRGLQGQDPAASDRVGACLKHFAGYSFPLSGKDRTPSWIPDRMMREIFLPPFRAGIEAGALSVMVNSGEVNGVPVHASRRLLTDVLRGELGFRGVVITDWEDIKKLVQMHRVAPSIKEATRMAVMAGIDMCMVPLDYSFTDALIELVREGSIPESRIDASVMRIIAMKRRMGLFDGSIEKPTIDRAAAEALSLRAARESLVLLQNKGALPLKKDARILLTGPGASSLPMQHGSWTWTWQGNDAAAYPAGVPTVADAMAAAFGKGRVAHVPCGTVNEEGDLDVVRKAAENADVIVAVVGEEPSVEKPGDIEDLTLSAPQRALVHALSKTGKPVVLVMLQGRPRLIHAIADEVSAIVHAGLPGPHGGRAISDILSGAVNPSGRLPFTYPRHSGSLVPYDHKESARADKKFGWNAINPQFPFGQGLSYTTFEYEHLEVGVEGDAIEIAVTVTNTGQRAGKHTPLLFVRDEVASVTPPVKRLRGFTNLSLSPGESRRVSWTLNRRDLAFVGRDLRWITEPGKFEAQVGALRSPFQLP